MQVFFFFYNFKKINYFNRKMQETPENISKLLEVMPESPPKWWSIEDFEKFLEFIELEPLKNLFRELFPFFFILNF